MISDDIRSVRNALKKLKGGGTASGLVLRSAIDNLTSLADQVEVLEKQPTPTADIVNLADHRRQPTPRETLDFLRSSGHLPSDGPGDGAA